MIHAEWGVESGEWRTHAEQSAAARQLLERLLGFTVEVEHDGHGAPYLPGHPELHVSLSHSRTAVAAAVSADGPVGIDVEGRRRVGRGMMERVCTADELATIDRSDDPTMAFLQLWTRKEAALKCRGTGIKGFGSLVHALDGGDVAVQNLACGLPDTVAALATAV
ncbi:MAG: 4'-phosphopantetheinyl transferase superfamily protein [Bacteroidales bacterium]|nr:4'-phosphopantetheinyl transferase superfamily protein [Bacteroidales bacterium]